MVKKLGESNDDRRREEGQNADWLENTRERGNLSSRGTVSNDDVQIEVKLVTIPDAFMACNRKKSNHTRQIFNVQYTFHRRKSK